jgi:hypothetical protein
LVIGSDGAAADQDRPDRLSRRVELVRPLVDHVDDDYADFDVAIIDLTLPRGLDDFGLAQRAAARGIAVILMFGDHSQFDRAERNAIRSWQSHFPIAELIRLIEEVLAKTDAACAPSSDADQLLAGAR